MRLSGLVLLVALVGSVSSTCSQCGAISVTLGCPVSNSSMPGTAGLMCDVVAKESVELTCEVHALHTGSVVAYQWKHSKDATLNGKTTKTISYPVTADDNVWCVATVADIYGTYHILSSNYLNIVAQAAVQAVTAKVENVTIGSKEQYTVLSCGEDAKAWYPTPDWKWMKDGKELDLSHDLNTFIMTATDAKIGEVEIPQGSLVLHGVSSNHTGQYTCSLIYQQRTALTMKTKPVETMSRTYNVNVTKNADQPETTTITPFKAMHPTEYAHVGEPVLFNCLAVGGNATEGAERLVIKWYRIGTDEGVVWKNTSNSECMKDGMTGDKSKMRKGDMEKDDCLITGTSTKSETVLLTGDAEAQAKYGVMIHTLSLLMEASYSELDSTYRCQAWADNATRGSAADVDFVQPKLLGGLGVETGSTCGYTKDDVTLPLDNFMTTFSNNSQLSHALPSYNEWMVQFNGSTVTPKVNKVNELQVTLVEPAKETSSRCQYYQVSRLLTGTSRPQLVLKTVLVENLGANDKSVYFSSNYSQSEAEISVSLDNSNSTVVHCNVAGNGSIAEWVSDCPADWYTLAEAGNSSSCGWRASITFHKSKMEDKCKAMCRSKSQCTGVKGVPFYAMPASCPVKSISNAKMFMKEDDMSGKSIFANDMIMPECEPGYQLDGPSMLKCGTDGALSSSATKCTDMSKVKCPTLEAGKGSLACTEAGACTYTCQANAFISNGTALVSSKKVTCNAATAAWSHMSKDNPTGNLPTCAGTKTPSGILTTATVEVSATSCPTAAKAKAAVIVTLKASSDTDYDCIDSGNCEVATVTCAVSSSSAINLKIVVNQTKSTTDASISTKLGAQLKADAVAKTFSISVDLSKKKRAASTLQATGTVSVATSSSCPSGSGSVGTSCITCAAGTYVSNGVCTSCPLHTYSSAEGQTVCTACPSGLKTFAVGQDSETDCSASTCEIATIANGITSPTSGWTVKSSTIVTTYCNANYSVGFEKEMKNECGSTARCTKMCEISEVAKAKKFTDAALKKGVRIDQGAEASLVCDSKKTVSHTCKDGDELKFSCSGSKVALVVGLCCVALLVVVALVMSAVVINKRKKRPESPGTPPPLPKRRRATPPPELTFFDKLVGTAKMVPVNIERKMSVAD